MLGASFEGNKFGGFFYILDNNVLYGFMPRLTRIYVVYKAFISLYLQQKKKKENKN